jgi:hypothetical protein
MSLEQTQKYCQHCQSQQLHARPGTSHLLHLVISLFLCGLWIPIWILSSMQIGGWRCQKCGTKAGQGAMGILALILILLGGITAFSVVSSWVDKRSNSTVSGTDSSPNERQETNRKVPSNKTSPQESPLQPAPASPQVSPEVVETKPTLPIESVYLKSLEGVPLPVTLVVDEAISLLDATGKEFPIAAGKKILVTSRSSGGTLKVMIDSKPYVGNEARLSKKVRIHKN